MRSSPEKLQEWRDRMKRFRESGLTQQEFCVLEQQSEKQFYYWARKFRGEISKAVTSQKTKVNAKILAPVKPVEFVPVKISPSVEATPVSARKSRSQIEVVGAGRILIRLPADIDTHTLLSVINAVEQYS